MRVFIPEPNARALPGASVDARLEWDLRRGLDPNMPQAGDNYRLWMHPPFGPAAARTLRSAFRELGQRHFAGVLWLDLGRAGIPDWRVLDGIWQELGAKQGTFSGVGFSGLSLLLPSDQPGHVSPEYLCTRLRQAGVESPWLGIPIGPEHAPLYLRADSGPAEQSTFLAMRRLGIRLQAELPSLCQGAKSSSLLEDVPGATVAEKAAMFLRLFPHFDSARVEEANAELIQLVARQPVPAPPSHPEVPAPIPAVQRERVARGVYAAARAAGMCTLECVELLAVLSGLRPTMRTTSAPTRWKRLSAFLLDAGLFFTVRTRKSRFRRDRGKGGWSNLYDETAECGRREVFAYVARDQESANLAALMETQDEEAFGALLGYPSCCRAAFLRNFPLSLAHQGDLVPIVYDQTPVQPPWSFLLNPVGRYFDAGLISFYPCSLSCERALLVARQSWDVLRESSNEEAERLRVFLAAPFLYTEYCGIHRFNGVRSGENGVRYDPLSLRSTVDNKFAELLRSGNEVDCGADGRFEILRAGRRIGRRRAANARLFFFNGEAR